MYCMYVDTKLGKINLKALKPETFKLKCYSVNFIDFGY
jgi:hypothetical protein